MARRAYSRLPDYRLTSDVGRHSGRMSSSSLSSSMLRSRTSSLISSSSQSSLAADSSVALPVSRSALSQPGTTCDVSDQSSLTAIRLSPKPNIRKYGRTSHSQAFTSTPAESPSVSRSSTCQQAEFSPTSSRTRIVCTASKLDKTGDCVSGTVTDGRRRVDAVGMEAMVKTQPILGSQAKSEDTKPQVSSNDEEYKIDQRLTSVISQVHGDSSVSDRLEESSDTDRSIRRLRRLQRREGVVRPLETSEVYQKDSKKDSQNDFNNDSKCQQISFANDSKGDHGETVVDTSRKMLSAAKGADVRGSRQKQNVLNKIADHWSHRHTGQGSTQVKIVVVAPDDVGHSQGQDALDESPFPVTDRVPGHVVQPAQREWTEEDLDQFVKQLSNPQHQVSKKSWRDDIKDPNRTREVLTRACPDIIPQSHDPDSQFLEGVKASRDSDEDSGSAGLISGFTGLRVKKHKKMARTSQIITKRSALLKLRDTHHRISALLLPDDVDEDAASSSGGDVSHVGATFAAGSSPEGSDGEENGTAIHHEPATGEVSKDEKKGRFRRMLRRPLNRSQSAGCAKDVPAHALFLQKQMTSKEAEWVEALKPHTIEGDIQQMTPIQRANNDSEVGADDPSNHDNRFGEIHKTRSAESSMTSLDDMSVLTQLGAVSHPKHKSRNIAKKISRKLFLRRRHTDSILGLNGKEDGARRLATVDPGEAQLWSKSFENLLFDKTGLELFRGFLMTEHSDENIEFWIACENYKNAKSMKQLPSLAMKIFNDYVAVQSKREINLDSKTRNYTYESVTCNPTRQTFDEAQRRVQALMEKDSYRRFLESEIYHDLASGNIQH